MAGLFGVNIWTYVLWEWDRTTPVVRYYPAILRFLGYDPFPAPQTWGERVYATRRSLGLTIDDAAQRAGVDPTTFARWERGIARGGDRNPSVQRFLTAAEGAGAEFRGDGA